MTASLKSRNRLLGRYADNSAKLANDYAHRRRRLADLNQASARNDRATDILIQRLRVPLRATVEHPCHA